MSTFKPEEVAELEASGNEVCRPHHQTGFCCTGADWSLLSVMLCCLSLGKAKGSRSSSRTNQPRLCCSTHQVRLLAPPFMRRRSLQPTS